PVRLTVDGGAGVDTTIYLVAVANGRYFGGGMHIAPHATLEDGLLDVVAVGDLGLGTLLRHGRRLYAGTHLALEQVSHQRGRTLEATPASGGVVAVELDGESAGQLPARFTLAPAALELVV